MTIRILLCTIVILMTSFHSVLCEEPKSVAPPQRLHAPGIPEKGFLTLQTENYTVPMDAASGWTIEKMVYQSHEFSLNNGHYGTVLRPQGKQWWGTGHTEGGREVVQALQLTVDGQDVPVKTGETIKGKRMELMKESIIWKFKARVEIVIDKDHIIQRTQLEALEDCDTDLIYYFMHCFPPTTTQWIAQLPDGSIEKGPLNAVGGMRLSKNSSWVAQFEPTSQLGILCYTPKIITGPGSASLIWDLDRYHKYYLRQNNGQSFQKGDQLDFTVIVKAVPNETGNWQATQKAASQLMKSFPPTDSVTKP